MKSLLAFALCLVFATGSFAQEQAASAKVDPTGTWRWERTGRNDNVSKMTLKLKLEGDKVVGTLATKRPEGARQGGNNNPIEIKDGKLDGNKISFTIVRSFNDREFVSKYAGTIDGDSIKGTQTRNGNNGEQESEWTAKRGISLEDAAGTWAISFEGPDGNKINSKFDITVEGEAAKGVYHSSMFGDNDIKDIAVKDGKLTFGVSLKTDNGEFPISYEAKIDGDKITGVMKSSFGGEDNERAFEGSRETKEESK